eukprot:TRINITY_DN10989_c0_g1_i1.p1 TRINITY_DN10989_c0_g1~~TRINITY_DN10989_c0_g1_i1.p1  ORF type:complete len:295 (+),score=15.67 TRINITY_DN10989_c0_g1_i1:144-1028(+)
MARKVVQGSAMKIIASAVKRILKDEDRSVRRRIVKSVRNAARRTFHRVPLPILMSKLITLLMRHVGEKRSNSLLDKIDLDYKRGLEEYGQRLSKIDAGYEPLRDLIRGQSLVRLDHSHRYRIKTLWCVILRFGFAVIGGPVYHLACLFPSNILDYVLTTSDTCWNNFLGSWIIRIFYFRKYNGVNYAQNQLRCSVDINDCLSIWKVFSSWEKAADLPMEITFLDYETLATFLPSDPTGCLVTWEREYEQSALARLCDFPFHDITTVPAHYYVLNPYTEKGYEFVSGFYLFLYRD